MIGLLLGWTKWHDILVFNWVGESYLLQGRRHKITNSKKFKIVRSRGFFGIAECGLMTQEKLEKADLFNNNPKS